MLQKKILLACSTQFGCITKSAASEEKYYYCVLPCTFTYFHINYNFLCKLHNRRQTVQFRGLNH